MTDWLIGWTNWLKWKVYPLALRRVRCRLTSHRDFQIEDTHWCTRCARRETEVRPGLGPVLIGCPTCGEVIEVPVTASLSEPDEDDCQHIEFDTDMADLWAHSWAHQEETP